MGSLSIAGQPVDPQDVHFRKYRKLPVVVQAIQLNYSFEVVTSKGTMQGNPGDFLVKGVQGELYPCKAGVFYTTYDTVTPLPEKIP